MTATTRIFSFLYRFFVRINGVFFFLLFRTLEFLELGSWAGVGFCSWLLLHDEREQAVMGRLCIQAWHSTGGLRNYI